MCQDSKRGKCACTIKKRLNKEREEIESHWMPFLEKMQEEEEMKIKEEKLTPKRMSYEVEDFRPGSLENNILQQIFGIRPAISNHETVQHNRYVHYGITIQRN